MWLSQGIEVAVERRVGKVEFNVAPLGITPIHFVAILLGTNFVLGESQQMTIGLDLLQGII